MKTYNRPTFEKNYGKTLETGRDILQLLDFPFAAAPMRATGLENGKLGEGRKSLIIDVLKRTLDYDDKPTLIYPVFADTFLKSKLEPFSDRVLAVTEVLGGYIYEKFKGREVQDLGYFPDADFKSPKDWLTSYIPVYLIGNGLRIRVIPSTGFGVNENPLLPNKAIKEKGLVFTGRKENFEKWGNDGYTVELVDANLEI